MMIQNLLFEIVTLDGLVLLTLKIGCYLIEAFFPLVELLNEIA
jgi:hypothetical protein